MKLRTFAWIIGAVALLAVIFIFTGGNRSAKHKNTKGDTTTMYVLFINDLSGNLRGGVAKRVIKDSLMINEEQVATWKRDTIYYIGTPDTLRDAAGKPIIDPVKHQSQMGMYYKYWLPSKYVTPTTIVLQ